MADREPDVTARGSLGPEPAPQWVEEMQEHFHRTGAYRPEDLKRVLGDPADRVEMGPEPEQAACSTRRS